MKINGKDFDLTGPEALALFKILDKLTPSEIKRKLCGKLIGQGLYRDVYEFKGYPNLVIKIERCNEIGSFCNATEWRHWIDNREWKYLSSWLAPCFLISKDGNVLIQRRVTWKGKKRKDYPKEIPSLFTDLKVSNFGWIGDRFVCCDYAFFRISFGKAKDTQVAKWWGSIKKLNA